ncbi:syndecan-2-like isoform X1 [Takifugu flavidus]|uniref:Syndecan n=1 Tax=Takifugu bimaculatus TaxID=433685 RepID=A0A4Z2CDT2_9TELE|nr:syndecan-2-like isoform X1 [Takifugu flavidus]TNN02366.1 hypothetical protein fugu_009853 [Takifugu bimaculatus]
MKNLRLLFLVGLATVFVAETVSARSPSLTTDDLYLEGRTSGNFPVDDEDGEDDGSGSGSGDYAFTDWMNQKEEFVKLRNMSSTVSSEVVPELKPTTAGFPDNPQSTAADSQHLSTTPKESDNKNEEVATVDPAADRFVRTSPSSPPPAETTRFSTDVIVPEETDGDNSLDRWQLPTPKDDGDQHKHIENEIVPSNGRGSRIYDSQRPEEVTSENLWERTEVLAAVIACGVVGFLCAVFLLLLLAYRMKKKDEGSYDLGDTKLSNAQYHKAPTKEFYA